MKRKNHPESDPTYYVQSEAPGQSSKHWAQTVSGTGWCTSPCLYGPLELWFDKS